MNYYDSAKQLSNSCVVDLSIIDSISYALENEQVHRCDLINLSRLIEAFVLSKEVVVKDFFLTINEPFDADDYDFEFTRNWLSTFLSNNVIKAGFELSASNLLTNEFCAFDSNSKQFNKDINNIMIIPDIENDDSEFSDLHASYIQTHPASSISEKLERLTGGLEDYIIERNYATEIWNRMTSHYGVPFLCENEELSSFNAKKPTNISLDLYRQIIEYNSVYYEEIARYLGPTYFNMPPLFGIVLKQCESFEDLPNATMSVRDKFIQFVYETTELEYQLRTADFKGQIDILQKKQRSFDNISNKYSTPKRYVQSRVLDIAQTLSIRGGISQAIKDARSVKLDHDGLLLIPGYYDLWKASNEIEQALPELKRVFGNSLAEDVFS